MFVLSEHTVKCGGVNKRQLLYCVTRTLKEGSRFRKVFLGGQRKDTRGRSESISRD